MLSEEAKRKAYTTQRRIHDATLERITVWIPKGTKEGYKELAKSYGMSLNALIINLLDNATMQKK